MADDTSASRPSRAAAASAFEKLEKLNLDETASLSDEEPQSGGVDDAAERGGGASDACEDDPPWRYQGHAFLRKRARLANESGGTDTGVVVAYIAATDIGHLLIVVLGG